MKLSIVEGREGMTNKYHAVRCWSSLVQRWFASKLERARGEYLYMEDQAGVISQLRFQEPTWVLSRQPKVTYTPDFWYIRDGKEVFEDSKGKLTEATRIKLAWVKDKCGIEVTLSTRGRL